MAPFGFRSHSGARPGNWTHRDSPPFGSRRPAELGRHYEHTHSPKRVAEEPGAPPTQRGRVEFQRTGDEGQDEFRGRRERPPLAFPGSPELVTQRVIQHALCLPSGSRPSCDVISPMGGPNRFMNDPVSAVDFNKRSPNRVFARGQTDDLLTTALRVGGGIKSAPRALRVLSANDELQRLRSLAPCCKPN